MYTDTSQNSYLLLGFVHIGDGLDLTKSPEGHSERLFSDVRLMPGDVHSAVLCMCTMDHISHGHTTSQ